jgi:hypothetical protein
MGNQRRCRGAPSQPKQPRPGSAGRGCDLYGRLQVGRCDQARSCKACSRQPMQEKQRCTCGLTLKDILAPSAWFTRGGHGDSGEKAGEVGANRSGRTHTPFFVGLRGSAETNDRDKGCLRPGAGYLPAIRIRTGAVRRDVSARRGCSSPAQDPADLSTVDAGFATVLDAVGAGGTRGRAAAAAVHAGFVAVLDAIRAAIRFRRRAVSILTNA